MHVGTVSAYEINTNILVRSGKKMKLSLVTTLSAIALAASGSTAFASADCSGMFGFTGSITTCTVSTTGNYSITAYGAQGGTSQSGAGGLGAEVAADISLTAGETLELLVGGQGGSFLTGRAGGGGGSFVVEVVGSDPTGFTPLVVAGGGGGRAASGGAAEASTAPAGISSGGAGGIDGNGGSGATAGGGGGFYTSGSNGSEGGGGMSFLLGGAGGNSNDGLGGFGGGGAGGNSCGGGAGGGYSGGGGGGCSQPGGGGGSYVFGSLTQLVGAFNTGNGQIYITLSDTIVLPSDTTAVPEPTSLTLFAGGLLALGAKLRGKRKSA